MYALIGLAVGAGLVSALLFSAVTAGSPGGMLLGYIAALPILIVGLGWTHWTALLAVAAGGAALSVGLRPSAAWVFAVGPGLPAWSLGFLALLGRPVPPRGETEWLPLGRLLLACAGAGAGVALVAAIALGRGDYAVYEATSRRVVDALLHAQMSVPRQSPLPPMAGFQGDTVVRTLVRVFPAVAGGVFTLTFAINLWLAGRTVLLSGRLLRPWPDVPGTRMPPVALGLWLVALALVVLGPGYVSVAGAALVGGLGMAFALQGLALLHTATRGRPARGAVLGFTYLLTLFFGGTILPLLALAGMADTVMPLRDRFARPGGPDRPQP
ncbi:MAG: hypothetical protein JO048_06685 [Methylobacteriaceae bacterium]|nr:hypothetical protein [Methylobacteriaceae bacterium]